MLRLSTKTRYALRAMLELALREGEEPVQLRLVARPQRISQRYVEQLALPLRRVGLLRAERGPGGGYALARSAAAITAREVVEAVEGPLGLLDCVGRPTTCDRAGSYAARELWSRAAEALGRVLSAATRAELRGNQLAALTVRPRCYQI